jgi:tetratricopeptide (TPR) repeat protein
MMMKRQNPLFIITAVAVFLAFVMSGSGCSKDVVLDTVEGAERGTAVETKQEDIPDKGQDDRDVEQEGSVDIADEDPKQQEEEIEMPEEITSAMDEALGLFNRGMYSEAAVLYRDIMLLVEDCGLAQDSRVELLGSIEEKYNQAREIIEAARIHHSNAMNLMYEKRFEEAKEELQAALSIYPGYQEALDAMASLEALEGLE